MCCNTRILHNNIVRYIYYQQHMVHTVDLRCGNNQAEDEDKIAFFMQRVYANLNDSLITR